MEVKRLQSNVLNTIAAAGANVYSDNGQYLICEDNAVDPLVPILGPVPYGVTENLIEVLPQAEVRQLMVLDNGFTGKEVIVAGQRYRIEIGNDGEKYETAWKGPFIFAYTAPVPLSMDDAINRAQVYTALANKVNAHAGVNATAQLLVTLDFTLGDATDGTPAVGTVITQAGTLVAGLVTNIDITGGAFDPAGDAAGSITIAITGDVSLLNAGAVAWTFSTDGTLTQTNATLVVGTGLAILDNAGYFISSKDRVGRSWVETTQGFATAIFAETVSAVYSQGIGAELAQLGLMAYDHPKMDLLDGDIDYELIRGGAFDPTLNYKKIIITGRNGDVDTLGFDSIKSGFRMVLWVVYPDGNFNDFIADLRAAVAL